MIDFAIDTTVPHQLTPELTFLRGKLSLWEYSIPFFTTNVPLRYAADNFKLFEDLAQADTGEWTLEELFQRDISWTRVETDILQYLKNPSRPQFFNALTVALLPNGLADFGQPHGPALALPPMTGVGLGAPIGVGGIQIQYFGSDDNVENGAGRLRWSVNDVDAVAVDGQHRLAAIKRFVAETKPDVWRNASVPVIFVIADERVGFRTPQAIGEKTRTVGALRALFIDLNKNARQVSATRNILLDDLDVVSVCTRALIGRSLSSREEAGRIPLALVDWLSDKNKIEDGPFVTTVMLLHEAVKRLLDAPDPLLDTEDNSVEKVGFWLDRMMPTAEQGEREAVMGQVQACAVQQSKLTWLPRHMEILKRAFEREWRPHFEELFSSFVPYRDLWRYAETNDLLNPQFVNLYVAREVMPDSVGQKREARLIGAAKSEAPGWNLEKRYQKPLDHIELAIKSRSWAYRVVFQRALLRGFVDLLRAPAAFFGEDLPREEITRSVVEAMNRLVAAGAADVQYAQRSMGLFWAGSGLSADGSIEFTNAGAERLRSWLLAFVVMSRMGRTIPKHAQLSHQTESAADWLRRTFCLPSGVVYKGMSKLAYARDLDGDDPDVVVDLIAKRYDLLRKLALG